MRIELTYAAWKAAVLPLNYTRITIRGVSEGNRTLDPLIKSQLLYHLSYRDSIRLGQRGSNSRMRESKSLALPLGYAPICPSFNIITHYAVFCKKMVETGGFEPPNPEGADLQSAAFSHFATSPLSADNRNRTYNLLITNQLLCQLSYVGNGGG